MAVSGGEAVTSYKVLWGDGTNSSGANPTMTHTYSSLGWFVVSGQALVGSTWHSGPTYLYPIEITPSYDTTSSGFYPTLDTTFTNGSTAATQFGWFAAPGSVTVSATYTANSTATGYTDHAPTLASTGGTQSNLVSTATSVSASYAFSTAGLFYITMVGAVTAPTGIVYQNFTWTVYVAADRHRARMQKLLEPRPEREEPAHGPAHLSDGGSGRRYVGGPGGSLRFHQLRPNSQRLPDPCGVQRKQHGVVPARTLDVCPRAGLRGDVRREPADCRQRYHGRAGILDIPD